MTALKAQRHYLQGLCLQRVLTPVTSDSSPVVSQSLVNINERSAVKERARGDVRSVLRVRSKQRRLGTSHQRQCLQVQSKIGRKYSVYNARPRIFFLSAIRRPKPEASNSHTRPSIKVFSRTGLRLDTFQGISSFPTKKRKLSVV